MLSNSVGKEKQHSYFLSYTVGQHNFESALDAVEQCRKGKITQLLPFLHCWTAYYMQQQYEKTSSLILNQLST
jgi:hypothetical protein